MMTTPMTPAGRAACVWKYDDLDDYYSTACGEASCFTDGGPVENSFKFCPYCGQTIEVALCPIT
jgi:hypothetical protein